MDTVILLLVAAGLLLALVAGSWIRAGRQKRKIADGTLHPTPGKKGPYDAAVANDRGHAHLYDLGTGQGSGGFGGPGSF